jgi:4-hydroxy-3-methylbut-2-en-1-yl diphosphate reductase
MDGAARGSVLRGRSAPFTRRGTAARAMNAPASDGLMEIVLARPRGFCAGVERAIAIVERALEKFGPPVYVKHAIVHNRHVVERLERLGAVFVEELSEVPPGARTVFSAHGVAPQVHTDARARGLDVVDATCPLVTKVHVEARRFAQAGRTIFLIGHHDHVEVIGTRGEAPEHIVVVGDVAEAERVQARDPRAVAYLTQTTLSLDDTREILAVLRRRFPALAGPGKDDICYATQNRQNAVQALVQAADAILVVGSANSSNSNRLVEVARARGCPAYLVNSFEELQPDWLRGVRRLGVTAGASAPEEVVQALVAHLAARHGAAVRELTVTEETVAFPLPAVLAG